LIIERTECVPSDIDKVIEISDRSDLH